VTGGVLPVWWDDAADGPTNMAADELLAEEAEREVERLPARKAALLRTSGKAFNTALYQKSNCSSKGVLRISST
jgi:hypothetical protein